MEAVEVAKRIENGCKLLGEEVSKLKPLSIEAVDADAEYNKAVGVATFKLKSEGHPTTLIPNMIKNECADLYHKKILAEALLKATYATIDSIKAKINAYQSINRYLSEA